METEDDMIVVIVGDAPDDDTETTQHVISEPLQIKEEPIDEVELLQILENAKNYGQPLNMYNELADFELNSDPNLQIKIEVKEELVDDDNDYVPEQNSADSSESESEPDRNFKAYDRKKKRQSKLRLSDFDNDEKDNMNLRRSKQIKSFVEELRQEYAEFKENESELIRALSEIMRSITRPKPPKDYFVMNDALFECCKCGAMTETVAASELHYQEKHGQRYLVCFACGRDFRSTTNLYKHEKRCRAPDAVIVLKARALWLGRKGRNRPFMPNPKDIRYINKKYKYRFGCKMCSASFSAMVALQAHINLHKGLRPYRCSMCDHAYTSKAKLVRHEKTHTEDRFICETCARPFKTKASLVVHMNTHMPLRQFPCEQCPKRYATKHALQQHFRRVHLGLPHACACPVCPQSFPRMSLVRDHMQREHGMSLLTRKMFLNALPTMKDEDLKKALKLVASNDESYSMIVQQGDDQ